MYMRLAISNMMINLGKDKFAFLTIPQWLSFAAVAILIFIIVRKIKLSSTHWHMFILTTLFWTSMKLVRSFSTYYPAKSRPEDWVVAAVAIGSAYGLISIFVRLPFALWSDRNKSRLSLVRFAALSIVATSLMVYIFPDNQVLKISLLMSAVATGIGASVWGIMNVMFAESLGKEKVILAISVLSIPPLLADYIAAPFQVVAAEEFANNVHSYGILWLFSAIFAALAFIHTYFIKEATEEIGELTSNSFIKVAKSPRIWLVSLLGFIVLYVKFSTSGNPFQKYFGTLTDNGVLIGFLDTMFSLPQLIAGVLAGLWMKKKWGTIPTVVIGLIFTAGFSFIGGILPESSSSAVPLFLVYTLNGIGYGITYNVLLGMAIEGYDKGEKGWAMGIYQTFNAVGIYFGSKIALTAVFNFTYKDQLWMNGIITLVAIIPSVAIIYFLNKRKSEKIAK